MDSLILPKRGLPVTIITGFLGSGKTTLLNHILTNNQDLKVAILVNEFGDIDIDSQLLISVEENMVSLSNGCICCTINDDLLDTVFQILESDKKIDYLIVETTGVADPLPIILTFLSPELRDLIRLDSVLTLIDADNFTSEHFDSDAALKQIIYGDIIILNKVDLVSETKIKQLEEDILCIKNRANILCSQYGKVPLPLILDINSHNSNNYSLEKSKQKQHHHHHNHDHDHDHHHSHHLEIDGFISISFECDRPFNVDKFQNFITDNIMSQVYRAKGILWFAESQLKHIFQLSGKRYDIDTEEWQTNPKNQLVMIGRNIDENQLKTKLKECLVS
ncbi:GTP-binding protein [Cyanobacterium aponinum FACHB-4101]|uniref:Cobalamin synthesis protein P47K n=1 Tax=Cyanobacterium aponinum (strain PCC 10605) TaxID=755178 RepID=K9Z9H4_CYAAP|nr:GTP-binding protein [Cyanobacterium aponinum]AFZ55377.1 cobalamin synthesis protein P47K [Cyanobacterium aponinum PCC 10605]MBD2394346.1 GTP-binding protein [Cyanobacterium aponinum FACHB-4101]